MNIDNLRNTAMRAFVVFTVIFVLYAAVSISLKPITKMGIGMLLAYIYAIITKPLHIRGIPQWVNRVVDVILITFGGISILYLIINNEDLIWRLGNPTNVDLFIGALGIIVIFNLCLRVKVLPIAIVAMLSIAYALLGSYIPGSLGNSGFSMNRIIRYIWLSGEGVFGSITMMTITILFIFILWGNFLQASGASDFFMRLAFIATRKLRSGPPMVAILGSSLLGTMVGSATANVVTTGGVTIPLMKKSGFSADFAGAVESAASTGGQILPPVMGIAAFIMVDVTGISYLNIAVAGLIPALLYYLCLVFNVHLHTLNLLNRKRITVNEENKVESFSQAVKDKSFCKGFLFFIPVIALVVLLMMDFSISTSGFVVVILTVLLSLFIDRKRLLNSIVPASKDTISTFSMLMGMSACIGIIVGMLSMTGFNFKMSDFIITSSGNSLFLALLFTSFASILLGMGMPTPAAYLLVALTVGPALLDFGVSKMAANLFILYFSVLSAITPPVATAVLAAISISQGNLFKTGYYAMRLATVAFIIPFLFVYKPAYLFNASVHEVIITFLISVAGIILLTVAAEGYLHRNLTWYTRLILGAGGLFMVYPNSLNLDILKVVASIILISAFIYLLKKPIAQ